MGLRKKSIYMQWSGKILVDEKGETESSEIERRMVQSNEAMAAFLTLPA